MHYFLIGLPGSGKSTLGKQLALALELPVVDTDKIIIAEEHSSIEEIFAQKGETYFRKCEHEVLKQLCSGTPTVISLGGGTPCFNNNINLILKHGRSIFLDVSPETLTKRLFFDKTDNRPMLKGKTEAEVMDFLKSKREERLPFYSQATIVLQNDFIQLSDLLKKLS